MAPQDRTLHPDKLPPGLADNILEAYKIALRIKEAQGIDDPLELTIRLEEPPRVYLSMGDVILAESAIEDSDLAGIFGGSLGSPTPAAAEAPAQPRAPRVPSQRWTQLRAQLAELPQGARQWGTQTLDSIKATKLKVSPKAAIASLLVAALAALPAYLVFRDRWLDSRLDDEALFSTWQNSSFTSELQLPPYFLLVMGALLLLLILLAVIRNPQQPYSRFFLPRDQVDTPPPELEEPDGLQRRRGQIVLAASMLLAIALLIRAIVFDGNLGFNWAADYLGLVIGLAMWQSAWPKLGAWITGPRLAMLAAHLMLVALLANIYAGWGSFWIIAPLFILAWAYLWRIRQGIGPIFWIVNIALVLYSFAINGWWFSVVGDEYIFFRDSASLIQDGLRTINDRLFDGTYIYGAHPFISSLFHYSFMRIFGANSFAWRFSSLYLVAVALIFFYQFFKAVLPRRLALYAVCLLGASHYVMSFGKIGYNNLQALFAMGLALGATAWAIRRKTLLSFFLLGGAIGFCFYVYPAALYVVPMPFLLLLLYHPPREGAARRDWAVTLWGMIVLIFPLFLQPNYWTSKIAGTLAFNPEITSSSGNTISHFLTNLIYTLLSPLYITDESHFVAVGYLDVLLASFFFIGLFLLLTRPWRHRMLAFTLFSFLYLGFLVGATHDRVLPPNTRMFILLPLWILIATYGLNWIRSHLLDFGFQRDLLNKVGWALVLVVLGLNLYQAYPLSYLRSTRYHNFEGLFLATAENYYGQQPEEDKQIVVLADPALVYIPALTEMLDLYQVAYDPDGILGVEEFPLSQELIDAMANGNGIVIVDRRLPDEERESLSTLLGDELGKADCPVATVLGDVRFHVWYSPGQSWACPAIHPFGLASTQSN